MTTAREVTLLRLAAQWLAGPGAVCPADAVRRLGALQGQDFPGAVTSVGLRTASRSRQDVEAALDEAAVVRSWPMRGTLHLVAAEDLPWMLELLCVRVLQGLARRWEALGLTGSDAERARELAVAALSEAGRLRRTELVRAIDEGGVSTAGQRAAHLLGYLARTGTICLGPTDGSGEQLYVLVDGWITAPRTLSGDEALAELARRFFLGHGPATVQDLARWAGMSLRAARTGLALARPDLATLEVDGVEHLMDPATPDRLAACRSEAEGVFLLPGFDEYVLGYRDRSTVLDPAFADRIVPGNNGMFRPTVVVGGRVVGTWRWSGRGPRRVVTATPFTSFPDGVGALIDERAAALP